jgi:hypothetical protein
MRTTRLDPLLYNISPPPYRATHTERGRKGAGVPPSPYCRLGYAQQFAHVKGIYKFNLHTKKSSKVLKCVNRSSYLKRNDVSKSI